MQLWAQPWSGIAIVELDGIQDRIDLYSPHSGFRRLALDGLADGPHRLRVVAPGERRARAEDAQVLLHHIVTGRAVRA